MKLRLLARNKTETSSTALRSQKILFSATLALFGLAGCHNDMWVQPKMKPQAQSDFFPDQQSNRQLVPHSVARSQFWTDSERYTGYSNDNKIATTFPFKMTRKDIERGADRFTIYCTPCHGALGNGQGMIAQRGYALRRPPGNYHTKKLRDAPVGHFYDAITNGFGTMYSYASRIEPDDRWRIAAYIRALQRSQAANMADVDTTKLTEAERKQIDTLPPAGVTDPDASDPNNTMPNGVAPNGTAPMGSNPNGTTGSSANPDGSTSKPDTSMGSNGNPNGPAIKETAPARTGSGTRSQSGQPAPALPNTSTGSEGSRSLPNPGMSGSKGMGGSTPPTGGN